MTKDQKNRYGSLTTVLLTFLFTAILAFAAWYFFLNNTETLVSSQPVVTEVKRGDLTVEIVSEGELLPARFNTVYVPASFFSDFSLDQIAVATVIPEGSRVEKGTVIANLDPSGFEKYKAGLEKELKETEEKMNNFEADTINQLKDLKHTLENARLDLEIRKIAVEQSLFDPVSAHERMKLEYSKTLLAYERALGNYEERRKSLIEQYEGYPAQIEKLTGQINTNVPRYQSNLAIQAPISGVLSYIADADGARIGAGRILTPHNRAIAVIEDTGRLVSKSLVEEEYFPQIKQGMPVRVFLKSNNKYVDAKVSKVNAQIENTGDKKYFSMEVAIENPGLEFLVGQTTVNTVIASILEDILYVPVSSVLKEGEEFVVFTSNGLKLTVEAKKVNADYMQIISGLEAGQTIFEDASAAAVQFN